MENKETIWALVVGVIIGGISYWFNPYNVMEIYGISIYMIMSVGSFFGAVGLAIRFKQEALKIALALTSGVYFSVLTRVLYDTTFIDKTTHNLLGLELIISGFLAFSCSIAGAFITLKLKRN
jgi:hypothetical protein